jgi:hypothetical protein
MVADAQASGFGYFWDTKSHDRGQVHLSYGYGFPRLEDGGFKLHKDKNAYRVEGIGPFIFKAEYGLTRQLSIGISATYSQYTSDWEEQRFDAYHQRNLWFKYGTKLHDVAAMLRLNYHWVVTPRSDLYIGGGMGYNYWKSEDFTTFKPEDTLFNALYKQPGPFAAEITLGYRYYFRQRNAIYIEAGYGKSIVQAGFVFKFRHGKRE